MTSPLRNRWAAIGILIGGAGVAAALAWLVPALRAPRPNVVLITVDTLRADHLGCYGYERNTSPRLEELCRSAWVFANAITPIPTTAPAHASILTGMHPSRHGLLTNGWKLEREAVTVAEILAANGYATQAFVSVKHLAAKRGFAQGFQGFNDELERRYLLPAAEATRRALDWLDATETPFFLWIHYWDPHAPYEPPEEADLFGDPAYAGSLAHFADPPEGEVPTGLVAADRARVVSLYDGDIRNTDAMIGRLLDRLEERGWLDDSLVIVTADHGEVLDEKIASHRYGFDHGHFLFEGNLRVPLIVRMPHPAGGRGIPAPVSTLDVAPTILDVLGIPPPLPMDGRSLLGKLDPERSLFVRRESKELRRPLAFPELAVRAGRWKYVWDADTATAELYDLEEDPGETTNLVEAQPETAARLHAELERWQQSVHGAQLQEIPEEQQEALKALAYLD
jgi:arylsulfatase A-like enzyme